MVTRAKSCRTIHLLALTLALGGVGTATAAPPQVSSVFPRGLQKGGTTTLTIDGADLTPEPRLIAPFEMKQTVKSGASPTKIQIEVTVPKTAAPGIYFLRLANAKGISNAVAIGLDDLPQTPLAADIAKLPVAMHGSAPGNTTVQTSFQGKKGQRIVVDVEARRLGSALDPLVKLNDARQVQIAWSQGQPQIGGDARLEAVLPADGLYSVELHDILYRAAEPSFFRLKIGELHYADLMFPMGLQEGAGGDFLPVGKVPDQTKVSLKGELAGTDLRVNLAQVPHFTGAAPRVLVGEFPEVVETEQPKGKPQAVAVPAFVNGRLLQANEEDRYLLQVKPGMKLRLDVLAARLGSPLDGVLTLSDAKGKSLASNDDQPATSDPGLSFAVPEGVTELFMSIKDLQGRGGANFLYRIGITPQGQPDFALTLLQDRIHIPQGGTAVLRIRATRPGYNGPVKLKVEGLPAQIQITGDEIPAGATDTLLTLTATREAPLAQVVGRIVGVASEGKTRLAHAAMTPVTPVTEQQPWLRAELALAVIDPASLTVAWDTEDQTLSVGATYSAKVKIQRAGDAKGAVRLSLLTSQIAPISQTPPNQGKPDINRTLRLQSVPVVPADQSAGAAPIIVPPDLPLIAYDLAIQAELLGADNKTVVATAVSPSKRFAATKSPPPRDPTKLPNPFSVFEDQADLLKELTEGKGQAALETGDKYSGKASLKVTPDQRAGVQMPSLGIKIRQNPGAGEYRYLRFAWKKAGGQSICLQLAHDGKFGPSDGKPAKFRYHAGPGSEPFGASDLVDRNLPGGWIVVTRDLYADFGEFTLTGLGLAALDGDFALFDHLYLGRSVKDFDAVKPK